jgi:C1A family cysteine protease
MKSIILKIELVVLLLFFLKTNVCQGQNNKVFNMAYSKTKTTIIHGSYSKSTIVYPFKEKEHIFSLAINANMQLDGYKSLVRVILVTESGDEFLIMEPSYIINAAKITISDYGEETAILNGVVPSKIKIELEDASILLESISYNNSSQNKLKNEEFVLCSELKKKKQDSVKIERITSQIQNLGYSWKANETSVSKLTYQQKMQVFGNPLPNLRGFEYYSGGVFDLTDPNRTKSALIQSGTCNVIESFDWRSRHGQNNNWMTPVRDQGTFGTCEIFAATGATEAFINLYYNQHLNLDLAEQKAVKCALWSVPLVLDYYTNTGAVLESCAPYDPGNTQACNDVCPNPTEIIRISGKQDLHALCYPYTEEGYKKMIIKYGPVASGIFSLNHRMTLLGFYIDNTDGKTVWIFKNSWGTNNSPNPQAGYFETKADISDLWGGYAPLPPITSLNYSESNRICSDSDGDGYYNWGIGTKPASYPSCPSEEDGDDSNPNLGPINDYGYCANLIRSTQTWQYLYTANGDVIVRNNGNLTISGATINLGCNSSFSVELGGTLTFNNGTIQ